MNSRDFIRTERKNGKHVLDAELTTRMVKEAFGPVCCDGSANHTVAVVPGFISRDRDSGETTNLGRGGSDYTAAIIAAALDAEVLEIWTDVDGFMTADPRVIKTAYTINELSYVEAMELCNFGAKVIYPPTIYPVCIKNIPIKVKNTFNPEHPGTLIKDHIENDQKPIKGISSIKGTTLITVTGLSMVGVIGVNRRIFTTLANKGISVFMVSQASSENSTSIGVRDEDADAAVDAGYCRKTVWHTGPQRYQRDSLCPRGFRDQYLIRCRRPLPAQVTQRTARLVLPQRIQGAQPLHLRYRNSRQHAD